MTNNFSELQILRHLSDKRYRHQHAYLKDGVKIFMYNPKMGGLWYNTHQVGGFLRNMFGLTNKEIAIILSEWFKNTYKVTVKSVSPSDFFGVW